MKMIKPADFINIEIDYQRPLFEFPDLNGEEGNPIVYWPKAISAIRNCGFKKEATFIKEFASKQAGHLLLPQIPYEEQFTYLARYLNFVDNEEILKEDSDFIYIKRKKQFNESTMQISFFNVNNIEELNDLVDSDTDLSITNCYGRNILYYLDSPEVMQQFIDLNKDKKWIDLFNLDNFNSTALTSCDNIQTFMVLLKEMYNQSPELTKLIFTGTDSFGYNASGVYLRHISKEVQKFENKDLDKINQNEWTKLSNYLSAIKEINPEIYGKIFNSIEELPFIKNDKTGKAKQLYLYSLMNVSISPDDKKTTIKKLKV